MLLHSSPGLYVTLYRGYRNGGIVWFVEVNKWHETKYKTDLREFSTQHGALEFYNETLRSNYAVSNTG